MGIRLYHNPQLKKPDMVAAWPGIGNIGLLAVDTLRSQMGAEELGEIEPWDFFYPQKVTIKSGIIEELEFPSNKFYYKRLAGKDLLLFIGEEQPTMSGRLYAEGEKAYQIANLVLDVAARFGCQRIFTSGAAVALTHHSLKPKVWAVASNEVLTKEIKRYENIVLMSEIEARGGQGSITGLNGLLLGVAKKQGFEAVCLMGEIPDYLAAAPFPYPPASKSVLEVLTNFLGIEIDYSALDSIARQVDEIISETFAKLPAEAKQRIEQRKLTIQPKSGEITEEDEKWMKEHIDELFRKRGKGDERAS